MSCDPSIVLHVTHEGPAFIVLFLDMRNAVSSHFLTVCTVQVSVYAGFRNQGNQNGRPQFVRDLNLQSLGCVDFCIATL